MSITTLPSFEPGSREWLEQRRRSVGGSEIAAILGLSKWDSRFSLWHRKAGALGEQGDNPEMEWGRRLEPVVLAKFTDVHQGLVVNPGGTFTRTDRPWQIASPDALIGEMDGLVEIKTARDDFDRLWGEPGTDEIPVYYRAQCLWYLDTLEMPFADVAVLISGSDYREYRVFYDADEAAYMREAAEEFIASLDNDQRPDIDAHQATYQAVRELHPEIDPVDVEIPHELARSFAEAHTEAKQAKDALTQATAQLADYMGNAQRATFVGFTVARRQARGDGTPYLVAARNLPAFLKREAS